MRSYYAILCVVLCLAGTVSYGQNISKTGVARVRLRSSGSILSNNQIKGYYFFYNLEKVDNKNVNYQLAVYDENLRQINEVNIVRPKNYALVDGAFNGEVFAFLFYDLKGKTTEIIGYDKALKQVGSETKPVTSKNGQMMFTAIANGTDASQAFLVPLKNKGFLYYGLTDGNKYLFEIKCYDNTFKSLWTKKATETSYNLEVASEGFQSEKYAGSLITKKKSNSSKDIDMDLMVQSIDDGKVLFRIPMETKLHSVSFSDVYFDEAKQNFVVFGDYYNKDDKEMKSQSLGFIHLTVDLTGKIIGEKRNSWAGEISKATPVNEKGKFDGSNTSVLVHDIIRTNDGQIFVVGEQYKKVASGAGIATQLLSAAAGMGTTTASVQLNVYNLVIFQFNSDYSIEKVHIFEKDKNVVLLPAGAGYMSSKMLSYYAKAIGGFDFLFSQKPADSETFSVAYINYDREKGSAAGNVLGMVVYTPEKVFSTDKMSLKRKSSEYYVYQAKEGYVLITEYFKKEKRMDSRLEKINF